ncbi:HEAT repeat domain-containing protein [Allostreptomyces psammosilenae]|uniref:HEAT repeat domain-containing protein n=1 Tax=Allostreptomyces psammosilenae TaxID=1892865 RepID=A0A852ZN67_9ACTN|nr:HEAT repeat domain-containing protein [Allostreptomyces psammosilenae]NYI03886.1 hypothetical protein [Allostreptomyces psammosilenae]
MTSNRLAFDGEIDFYELARHGRSAGWTPETPSEHPVPLRGAAQSGAFEFIWKAGASTRVRFVHDTVTEVRFIEILGDGTQSVTDHLSTEFNLIDYQACLRKMSEERSETSQEHLLEALGAISPRDFSGDVYAAITEALQHESPIVRAAAVSAAGELSWSEFRRPLQETADHDPDPNLRAFATNTIFTLK